MIQTLTHSRLACFRTCPRKHYLRYELGLRSEETSFAMRVGSAFHAALEAADKGEDVSSAVESVVADDYDMALVAAMYQAHADQYPEDGLDVVAAELPFDIPLRNPATGAASTTWRLAGVIDRIVGLDDGRFALMEYKTTSLPFEPGAEYWMKLHMDMQLSIYLIAARALGYNVETILYDVTRRPGLRPKMATPEDKRKYKKDGTLYASCREEDETPEEFATRIRESIDADPARHFARVEIARLDQDLDECAYELWMQQKAVREAQKAGRWYRNPGLCFSPFRCTYVDICGMRDLDTHTPAGYVRDEEIHPELAAHATDGG